MLSVIIPAYNEEKSIEAVINQVNRLSIDKEIIVVDDCSKDRTGGILGALASNNLKIIHHISNRGKLAAIFTGIANSSGEYILIQEVNLEYGLSECPKLLEAIKNSGADIVLGSRFNKLLWRNILLNMLFGVKLTDWFTRCQLIRRESFLKLLPQLKNANITFDILTKAIRKKMRIVEVPIEAMKES